MNCNHPLVPCGLPEIMAPTLPHYTAHLGLQLLPKPPIELGMRENAQQISASAASLYVSLVITAVLIASGLFIANSIGERFHETLMKKCKNWC